jgi:hypothetical protein
MTSKSSKAGGNGTVSASQAPETGEAMTMMGEILATAGALDVAQGTEALAAAQQLEVQGDVVASLGDDELDRSMELGAIAGQLAVASEILYDLQMPEMASFLRASSDSLHSIAVEGVHRYAASQVLSESLLATSNQVGVLGANEMLEGMARQDAADAVLAASEDLAAASAS